MPQPLPRAFRHQQQLEDRRKIDRLVAEAVEEPSGSPGVTAGGDGRRLRGIPTVARGTGGAVPGTDPVRALLAKERRP